MADKPQSQDQTSQASNQSMNAITKLSEAGMGNMMGMSSAWVEVISDFNAEVVGFVTERIKEDVKTQHEIMQCKNVSDLQSIQAKFLQKAMNQYQEETGKLVDLSTKGLGRKDNKA